MSETIYAIATMDTKGEEIAYVAERIEALGVDVLTLDAGTGFDPAVAPDVSRETIASYHPDGPDAVLKPTDRGRAVTAMSEAMAAYLQLEYARGNVGGVVGVGGSGGTAIAAAAMRALPIGLPKLLISTVASGNVAPYIGCSDITIMYSVVDVAGINRVSRQVLGNAAHAIAGMALHEPPEDESKPTISMTMFGVTTPCVTAVREQLETKGYDCLVFHATGSGGRAMEKLVSSGMIDGVLDITTTEAADEIAGGILSAGPERFDVILEKKIPYVFSLGALDMVNFGAKETVPDKFKTRTLHVHNAQVTLMRTTVEENRRIAGWIADKINRSKAPVKILIPEKGVSAIDAPGQPFYDPAANAALFEELESSIMQTESRVIQRLPYHINDPEFSSALVDAFLSLKSNSI